MSAPGLHALRYISTLTAACYFIAFNLATFTKIRASNPTGTSSVTASPIHKIGFPGHERAMMSPMAVHATSPNHHEGFEIVRAESARISVVDAAGLRYHKKAIVPYEKSQMPSSVPFRIHDLSTLQQGRNQPSKSKNGEPEFLKLPLSPLFYLPIALAVSGIAFAFGTMHGTFALFGSVCKTKKTS